MAKPRTKPDLQIRWGNGDGTSPEMPAGVGGDFRIAWTAHPGAKQTSGMLVCAVFDWRTSWGASIVEELDRRGYDLKTLRISIRRKPGM